MGDSSTVTAVLVGYDGDAQLLLRAIDSLRGQTLPPAQVVCVDQSTDGRFGRALRERDDVEVVSPGRNLGYPSACNLAAAAATGDFLLFLNPDAEAAPGCVAALAAALDNRPDAAIAGAQILLAGGERVNAGDNGLHLSGISWAGRYGQPPEVGPPRPAAVVSGAALLVRRNAFAQLGGYTDGFFMYYDDVDLAWRARLRGWEVLFCPAANVVHDYEFSKGDYKWLWLERNRWWSLLCNFESRTLALLAPLLVAVEGVIWIRAAREGWLKAKLRSYRRLWSDRHALFERRREIQATRTVGDRAIIERMRAEVDSPFLHSGRAHPAERGLRAYRRLVFAALR